MMNNSFVKFFVYLAAFGVFGPLASFGAGNFQFDLQGIALLLVLLDVAQAFAPSLKAFSEYLRGHVSEGGKSIVLDSKKDKGKLAVINTVRSLFGSVFGWVGKFGPSPKKDPAADQAEEKGEPVEIRLDRTKNETKV